MSSRTTVAIAVLVASCVACSAEPPVGVLEIGYGEGEAGQLPTRFVPLADGDEIPIVLGA